LGRISRFAESTLRQPLSDSDVTRHQQADLLNPVARHAGSFVYPAAEGAHRTGIEQAPALDTCDPPKAM